MVTESPYDVFLQLTEHTETNCSTCKNKEELKSQSFKSEVLSVMINRGTLMGMCPLRYHPTFSTVFVQIALAIVPLIITPTNCTFSESFKTVADYSQFL